MKASVSTLHWKVPFVLYICFWNITWPSTAMLYVYTSSTAQEPWHTESQITGHSVRSGVYHSNSLPQLLQKSVTARKGLSPNTHLHQLTLGQQLLFPGCFTLEYLQAQAGALSCSVQQYTKKHCAQLLKSTRPAQYKHVNICNFHRRENSL